MYASLRILPQLKELMIPCSPYYIWLGRPRECDVSRFCHAFEVEGGNQIGNCSPGSMTPVKDTEMVPPLEIGSPALDIAAPTTAAPIRIDITAPLSSFHYQVKNVSLILTNPVVQII